MHTQDHFHCSDYLRKFSDYIDGELSAEFCSELETHMKDCPNCRVVLNTLQRTVEIYHNIQGDEVLPDEVKSRLYARLELNEATGKSNGEKSGEDA
jgi:anti-sigma factor RsiW